jgi:thymidine kinase
MRIFSPVENTMSHHTNGHPTRAVKLEVIAGPMFSEKTLELIRRVRRAQHGHEKTICFYPNMDTRTEEGTIGSRPLRDREPAIGCNDAREILELIPDNVTTVGIDEGQFWNMDDPRVLSTVCLHIVRVMKKRCIVAGLDIDASDEPFEVMARMMALSDDVTSTHCVCVVCGTEDGSRSQRLVDSNARTLVGDKETYEGRCTHCFEPR